MEILFPKQAALTKNFMNETTRKTSLRNKARRSFVQNVNNIDFDYLEAAFLPSKNGSTERWITPSRVMRSRTNKTSNDSYFQHCSETSASNSQETASVMIKVTEEADRTPDKISNRPAV